VLFEIAPEVPVMVSGYVPASVKNGTLIVSEELVVELAGLNVPLTPMGSPETAKLTAPLNPLPSLTVIVSLPVAVPRNTVAIVRVVEPAESVNGNGLMVNAKVAVATICDAPLPDVPVIVTV
jgi:hypothetical protein